MATNFYNRIISFCCGKIITYFLNLPLICRNCFAFSTEIFVKFNKWVKIVNRFLIYTNVSWRFSINFFFKKKKPFTKIKSLFKTNNLLAMAPNLELIFFLNERCWIGLKIDAKGGNLVEFFFMVTICFLYIII